MLNRLELKIWGTKFSPLLKRNIKFSQPQTKLNGEKLYYLVCFLTAIAIVELSHEIRCPKNKNKNEI